jgi:plastocyanin
MKRLTAAVAAVLFVTLIAAMAAGASCGGLTTTEIYRTTEAENKVANATATAQAAATSIAKGETERGGAGDVTGGQGGLAGALRATAAAAATATAAAGGSQPAAELTATPTPSAIDVLDPPPGDPLSGEVTVKIGTTGRYDPEVIKIKAGTRVTWENTERTQRQTIADPGQAEQWDSGNMARPLGSTENVKYSHTFTKSGRFSYASDIPGAEDIKGVVFVVP